MPSPSKSLSESLIAHPAALCNQVRRIAIEAGRITLDYFDESGFDGVQSKGDGSPVTIADQQAEKAIEKALADITPDIPMIGEEKTAAGRIPDLSDAPYFWLVDALDGTREFISGSGDYSVNIALIKDNKPFLGVVYAPVLGLIYAGFEGSDPVKWNEETGQEKVIQTRQVPSSGYVVVTSKSHGSDKKLQNFLEGFKVNKVLRKGSSLKMCVIAEGKADIYPRFGPTCEWDTAAADAILRSAGGGLKDIDGNALTYRKTKDKFYNPEFIAWGK